MVLVEATLGVQDFQPDVAAAENPQQALWDDDASRLHTALGVADNNAKQVIASAPSISSPYFFLLLFSCYLPILKRTFHLHFTSLHLISFHLDYSNPTKSWLRACNYVWADFRPKGL